MIPLIMFLFIAAFPVLLIVAGGQPILKNSRRFVPSPEPRRKTGMRLLEALLILVLSLPILVLLLFEVRTPNYMPAVFAENFAMDQRLTIGIGLAIGALAIAGAAIWAWRRSSSTAAVAVGLILCFGTLTIDVVSSSMRDADRQSDQEASVPSVLTFDAPEDLNNAELHVNGKLIGPLPLTIAAEELFSQIPVWTRKEYDAVNDPLSHEEWAMNETGFSGDTTDYWGDLRLDSKMNHSYPERYIYVSVQHPTLTCHVDSARMHRQPGQPYRCELNIEVRQWQDEIELLLDRVRMADYQPTKEWIASFESYGEPGWNTLNFRARSEPALWQVVDAWAAQNYNLEEVTSADRAWTVLMQICEYAGRNGDYDSRRHHGRAVELLVPHLDPQQLADYAVENVPNYRTISATYSSTFDSGRPGFRIWAEDDFDSYSFGLLPIAHAVWHLDRTLDEEDSESENTIERTVTPAILRRSFRNRGDLRYAMALGGRALDTFLLRQNWRTEPADGYGSTYIGDHENRVNGWYAALLKLDSPAGREFRNQQQSELLQLAQRACASHDIDSGHIPDGLEFLFLDKSEGGQRSLATRFLPTFTSVARGTPDDDHVELSLRWRYLARMWPESNVQMFVDALLEQTGAPNYPRLPDTMAVEDRFVILMASHDALQKKLDTLTKPKYLNNLKDPYTATHRSLGEIERMLSYLPHPAAAPFFLQKFGSNMDLLSERIANDTIHDDIIEQLAQHELSDYRFVVLPAIQNHPTKRRRQILETLLKDDSEEVRDKAAAVQQFLQSLNEGPLPQRKP